jgi:hypothetical protein
MLDIKVFILISEEEIYLRRMKTKAVPESYFHQFIIPSYQNYLGRAKKYPQGIDFIDGHLPQLQIFE